MRLIVLIFDYIDEKVITAPKDKIQYQRVFVFLDPRPPSRRPLAPKYYKTKYNTTI